MKKRLLFIMDTFPLGGISKSLLALFSEIGCEYDVDFMLFKREGLFLPLIPHNISLINPPIEEAFRNPHPKYFIKAFRSLSFSRFLQWLYYSLKCTFARLTNGLSGMVCTMDTMIAKLSYPCLSKYDVAIAYQGGRCIYYIVEKVDAKIKVGYVHSDYSVSKVDHMMKKSDEVYFPHLNYIITISPKCVASLCNEFPMLSERVKAIENICSPKMIFSMSQEGDSFKDNYKGLRFLTMGRIDINQKGIDYVVDVCKILKNRGYSFRWYFLGDGAERHEVERMIQKAHIENEFILLGSRINPYPYIKDSDIYIQPSRYEGKSVALDEVKTLHKPIVVTNFSTVMDQFVDGETALIAEMNAESIAEKIILLIENPSERERLTNNLKEENVGNEEQTDIFRKLVEGKAIND